MTQTEAIRTIAEYDGWEYTEISESFPDGYFTKRLPYPAKNKLYRDFDYHTNITSLYFVAGRVVKELAKLKNYNAILPIHIALTSFSPDFNPLLMAVADGVEVLKTYK